MFFLTSILTIVSWLLLIDNTLCPSCSFSWCILQRTKGFNQRKIFWVFELAIIPLHKPYNRVKLKRFSNDAFWSKYCYFPVHGLMSLFALFWIYGLWLKFSRNWLSCRPMHEITFSTIDRPKLLSEVVTFSPSFSSLIVRHWCGILTNF